MRSITVKDSNGFVSIFGFTYEDLDRLRKEDYVEINLRDSVRSNMSGYNGQRADEIARPDRFLIFARKTDADVRGVIYDFVGVNLPEAMDELEELEELEDYGDG